jgi:hypothetical protein
MAPFPAWRLGNGAERDAMAKVRAPAATGKSLSSTPEAIDPPTADGIDKLSPREQEVLGWVYVGEDGGHPQNTLDSLVHKGWIESFTGTLPGKKSGSPIERLPITVKRYTFPSIAHHMAWCEWCARQPGDDPELSRPVDSARRTP